jgi:hypothetical protein
MLHEQTTSISSQQDDTGGENNWPANLMQGNFYG